MMFLGIFLFLNFFIYYSSIQTFGLLGCVTWSKIEWDLTIPNSRPMLKSCWIRRNMSCINCYEELCAITFIHDHVKHPIWFKHPTSQDVVSSWQCYQDTFFSYCFLLLCTYLYSKCYNWSYMWPNGLKLGALEC